uniref:Uncharacterized protein n=1 Tax=Anguilla anguilla TaxID=7936 RepID=A0A0E9U2D6_ANGAN
MAINHLHFLNLNYLTLLTSTSTHLKPSYHSD